MKDFYDLWTLPKAVKIDSQELADTIRGTFSRRETAIPTTCPVGLSLEFSTEQGKETQWRAYSNGTTLEGKPLAEVTAEIWSWLQPACQSAS